MHKIALGFIVAQCRAIVFVHRLRFTSLVFVLARKVKVQVSFALLPHTANPTMLYYPLQTHQLCVHHFSAFLDLFPFGSVMFPSFRRRWRRWCAMLVTWQRVRWGQHLILRWWRHLMSYSIPCKTIPGEMRQVDVAGHPVLLCRDQGHLKVKATRVLVAFKLNFLAHGQTKWRYIIMHCIVLPLPAGMAWKLLCRHIRVSAPTTGHPLPLATWREDWSGGDKSDHCLRGFWPAKVLRCPWHGACFSAATGDIEDFPGLDSLATHQVCTFWYQVNLH